MTELRLQLIGCDGKTEQHLRRRFERDGVRVGRSLSLEEAGTQLLAAAPDVVLLDAGDGDEEAAEQLSALKERLPELPVILLAAAEDVSTLVGSVRGGVFDVVPKPLDLTRLDLAIKNASQMHRLLRRVQQLQDDGRAPSGFHGVVGESHVIRDVVTSVEQVARTDVPVIVTGEGGTGKGAVARAIHAAGSRRTGAFVALQCAAVPAGMLESELFGHEAGAFEGAHSPYAGCCERADGGTLFIEEICDVPTDVQGKLLQFLRGGSFRRLGAAEPSRTDARVIVATSHDPADAIREGLLREDLYYRVNVITIQVPPLRRRRGDVPLLAQHFLSRFTAKYGRFFQGLEQEAVATLERFSWPGNVRQLENVIERIVVLYDGPVVTQHMLPPEVLEPGPVEQSAGDGRAPDEILPFTEIERREIVRALRICEGNVSHAAERLGIGQATLYRKIKKYGLKPRKRSRAAVGNGRRA